MNSSTFKRTGLWCGRALLAVGGIGSAFAQSSSTALSECRTIPSDKDRLACYDRLSQSAGQQAAQDRVPQVTTAVPSAPAAAPADARSTVTVAGPGVKKASLIDSAWGLQPSSDRYAISFYRPNYLLFGRYTSDVNNAPYKPLFEAAGKPAASLDSTEAAFQLSFKGRFWATDDRRFGLWAAYTQQSQWQVYNSDLSRPFRETNYMPEIFASYGPDVDLGGGFRWKLLNAGFNHQSNGRTDVLSRSWNRLFAEFGVEKDDLALSATLWYRLKEDKAMDDNPDITDYYGHGRLAALYRWKGNSLAGEIRGNLSTGKGAVKVGWFSPPLIGPFRGYVQVFSGYGETMIDYNWKQTTVGIGLALNDGL